MEKIINPTMARTNLFSLIKNANRDSQPVIIAGANDSRSAVLIGKKDYDALQETMNLMMNGQIQATFSRKDDESVDLNEMIKEIDNE
ncbi:type II toxin-antitoxin system Phd/YefM family antitoxin [Lactobacillus helveticus]|uniref:type II toxin-antitoxin system Phd/YefM family antitoxin n=1 Tax=Lactobacillus helveticus TaxID=1587 RepID=UPI001C64F08F|nr:type II toxin-antitoxin system Phd/YefM family antitoxin [Lactobacillus helveticus]MBW7986734.1 type II toxin-antitoxin system Phd/YefM family antitoxin [Lactobacillus helveticus]